MSEPIASAIFAIDEAATAISSLEDRSGKEYSGKKEHVQAALALVHNAASILRAVRFDVTGI